MLEIQRTREKEKERRTAERKTKTKTIRAKKTEHRIKNLTRQQSAIIYAIRSNENNL